MLTPAAKRALEKVVEYEKSLPGHIGILYELADLAREALAEEGKAQPSRLEQRVASIEEFIFDVMAAAPFTPTSPLRKFIKRNEEMQDAELAKGKR